MLMMLGRKDERNQFCENARKLIKKGQYDACRAMLTERMAQNPEAPEPHNLLGLLLEKQGEHETAMKHFRAAWALDPSYKPASKNLEAFGMEQTKAFCDYGEKFTYEQRGNASRQKARVTA